MSIIDDEEGASCPPDDDNTVDVYLDDSPLQPLRWLTQGDTGSELDEIQIQSSYKISNNLSHFELYPSVNCGENKRYAILHSNLFLSSKKHVNTYTFYVRHK